MPGFLPDILQRRPVPPPPGSATTDLGLPALGQSMDPSVPVRDAGPVGDAGTGTLDPFDQDTGIIDAGEIFGTGPLQTGPMQTGLQPTYGVNTMSEKEADAYADDPRFNTVLDPEEEQKFLAWKQENAPQDSGYDYDLRGAYKSGLAKDPASGHWNDKYKKPNHPTFSDQSLYAPLARNRAGTWIGEKADQYVPADAIPEVTGIYDAEKMFDEGSNTPDAGQDQTYLGSIKDALAHDPQLLVLMSAAKAAGSGVEMIGNLLDMFGDDTIVKPLADKARASGKSMQQYIDDNIAPEFKQSMERSWLDLSSEGAWRDPNAWVSGVASQVPFLAAGLLGGEAVAGGLLWSGANAGLKVAPKVAGALGYGITGAGLSAGDAAQSASQAAEEAGLSDEQRRKAERIGGLLGAAAGAITGPVLGRVFHGQVGGLAATVAVGTAEQMVEEGLTQAGAETGKTSVGLPFDWTQVGEATAQAAGPGGAFGVASGLHNQGVAQARRAMEEAAKAHADAEAAAIKAEGDRVAAERVAQAADAYRARQREFAEAEDRERTSQGWRDAPQAPGESAPIPGARRPGPAPYGPSPAGAIPDFVAGMDPSLRRSAPGDDTSATPPAGVQARDQLAEEMTRHGAVMVDLQDAIQKAAKDPKQRAKLVGEWRTAKDKLDRLTAEWATYQPTQAAVPVGEPTTPETYGPQAVTPPVPEDMDANAAYTRSIGIMHELQQRIRETRDPAQREAMVDRFRELNRLNVDLWEQKQGNQTPSAIPAGDQAELAPAETPALAGPEAPAGLLSAPPRQLTGPSLVPTSADLGLAPREAEVRPAGKGAFVATDIPLSHARRQREAIQEPRRLTPRIMTLEDKLDDLRRQLLPERDDFGKLKPPSASGRAKLVGQYRTTVKEYQDLIAQHERAVTTRDALGGGNVQQQLPFEGVPGVLPVDYPTLGAQLDARLPPVGENALPALSDLERQAATLTVEPAPPPLLAAINERVKRSQASKAGAITRAQRRAQADADQTLQPDHDVFEDPSNSQDAPAPDGAASTPAKPQAVQPLPDTAAPAASMGAELTAIRSHFPIAPPAPPDTPSQGAPQEPQGAPPAAEATQGGSPVPPKRRGAVRGANGLPGVSPENAPTPSNLERRIRAKPQTQAQFIDAANGMIPAAQAAAAQLGNPPEDATLPDPTNPVFKVPEDSDPQLNIPQAALMLQGRSTTHSAKSPRNVLARFLQDGPKTAPEVLEHLYANAKADNVHPNMLKLMERLMMAFPATSKRPSGVMVENRQLAHGFQGLFDFRSNIISIDLTQAEDVLQATLHEMVHAAVVARMANPETRGRMTQFAMRAKGLWEEAGKGDPASEPGFRSVQEFIAEALTDTVFQDNLNAVFKDGDPSNTSMWSQLKNLIKRTLGFTPGSGEYNLVDALMEFIPDGDFLQDTPNREAVLAELDRLGLPAVNALMSRFASILRPQTITPIAPLAKPNGRVIQFLARQYASDMIVQSFGKYGQTFLNKVTHQVEALSNVIGRYGRLMDAKGGYATDAQAKGSKIVEVFKNALANNPASEVGEAMRMARMYALDPALPSGHIANAFGMRQPGATRAYAELQSLWTGMSQDEKDVFQLVRDHGASILAGQVNWMMIHRLRLIAGDAAADQLTTYIHDQTARPPIASATGSAYNINLAYAPMLSTPEIQAQVAAIMATATPAEQARAQKAMTEVHDVIKGSGGPYFPLRRYGNWIAGITSAKQTDTMTRAELDRMVEVDREQGTGSLQVGKVVDLGGNMVKVDYHHEQMEAFDSEREAKQAHQDMEAAWDAAAGLDRNRRVGLKSQRGLKRDDAYEAFHLEDHNVDAIKQAMVAALGQGAGTLAANAATDWFLDKLPSTSVKKSRMTARRVQGSSNDMLRAYSDYALGSAFLQAQIVYGHQINRALTTDAKADLNKMTAGRAFEQASDLRFLTQQLQERQQLFMETAAQNRSPAMIQKAWRVVPNIAATWLLTGVGTMITNMFQVPQMSLNHLGARYGFAAGGAALLGAYRDVIPQLALGAGKEAVQAVGKLPKAARSVFHGFNPLKPFDKSNRGLPTPSIRDPRQSPLERVRNQLADPFEKKLIDDLAASRKLDFGLVADLQAIASAEGRLYNALGYVTDAAFIAPQAVETMNRAVTALATFRLHRKRMLKANPGLNLADPAVFEELSNTAADAVDATQFNYGRENKSPLFQNEAWRAALVFKNFAAHMVYTVGHNFLQAINAETKEERIVAAKFLGGWGATTLALTGLSGMITLEPIYAALVALMYGLGGDDDDPEDMLRRYMEEWPETLRMGMLKGLPYLGGVDLSQRLGMSQLIPLQDMLQAWRDPDSDTSTAFTQLGVAMAGVPGSIAKNVWDGGSDMIEGDFATGMTKLTPKAFGINDAVRAWNYANYGVFDKRTGAEKIEPEELGTSGWVTRALGFTPAEVAEKTARDTSFYNKDKRITAERQSILDAYGKAALAGDDGGIDKAIDKAIAFSEAHPEAMIKKSTLLSSIKQRQERAAQIEAYGIPARNRAQQYLLQEIDPRYNLEYAQ